MKSTVDVKWNNNMSFEADIQGYKIKLDASKDSGGNNEGPTPKPFLLASLGGCTGMDVISILKKMQVNVDSFNVKVDGVIADEHPKKYLEIKLTYEIKGKNIPLDKFQKAVNLSIEKYCGVYATLVNAVKMTHEILISE